MVKFGVGCSTNWDPKVAGVEATVKALEQVNYKPKFLLVFCTIHYAKEKDGLQKLLAGCRSLVENDIPSIGGTVTGFICPEGCHTRGTVVVAGSGEEIEAYMDYESNTRRNPSAVGKKVARRIKNQMIKSKNKNKVIFSFMSGPIEPKILTSGVLRQFIQKIPHRVVCILRDLLVEIGVKYFNTGPAMEETVLESMKPYIEECYLVGCSTFDDMKALKNFQFFNEQVLNGSLVTLTLAINSDIIIEDKIKLKSTGKKFRVKTGWGDFCINDIEDEPFMQRYITEMGWPREYLKTHVEELTKVTFYYPLGFREDDGWIKAFPIGVIFGETSQSNQRIKGDEVELFLTQSKEILSDYESFIKKMQEKNCVFTFVVEAMYVFGILGEKINLIKKIMDEQLEGKPYLIIYGAGEHFKEPKTRIRFDDYARVMMAITNNAG